MKKDIINNTLWIILEKLIRAIINLFLWGKIANSLGVDQFGTFSYFQAIMFLLIPFSTLGIDQIIRNKISINPDQSMKYISTGIYIKFYCSCFLTFVSTLYLLIFNFEELTENLLFLFFIYGLIFRSVGIIEFYFDAKLESRTNGFIRLFAFVATCCLYFIALLLKAPVYWFALIFSIEFLITSLALWLVLYLDGNKFKFIKNRHLIFEILWLAIPIFLCDVCVCIFLRINQILLGILLSDGAVGIYASAIRFTEFWYFIPSSLAISAFSILSISYNKPSIKLSFKSIFCFEMALLSSFGVIAFTYLFSEKLILFFYGDSYSDAIELLKILILSCVFMFWGVLQEPIDVARKMLYFRLFRVCVGAIICIISSYFFITHYGIEGAAWSLVFTFCWTYFISNLFSKNGRQVTSLQVRSLLLINTRHLIAKTLFKPR